jgi:hypothetical protein
MPVVTGLGYDDHHAYHQKDHVDVDILQGALKV